MADERDITGQMRWDDLVGLTITDVRMSSDFGWAYLTLSHDRVISIHADSTRDENEYRIAYPSQM